MKWLRLHVGGQLWTVNIVSERHAKLRDEDGSRCKGMAYRDDCKIYIAREQSEQAFEDTLLHELLHVMLWVTGASHAIGDEEKEEHIVRDLTPIMHRLLKDMGFHFPKATP